MYCIDLFYEWILHWFPFFHTAPLSRDSVTDEALEMWLLNDGKWINEWMNNWMNRLINRQKDIQNVDRKADRQTGR